jgi:hypothetical protein
MGEISLRERWQAKPKEAEKTPRGAHLLSAQTTTRTNPKFKKRT